MPALIAHLKPYRLDVVPEDGAITCSDRGLPIAGAAGMATTFGLYAEIAMLRALKDQAPVQLKINPPPPAPSPAPAQHDF